MKFAETISRVAYNRGSSVDDPKNSNKDWRAGYAAGFESCREAWDVIRDEFIDRGSPSPLPESFVEWKIGFWAGRFTRIDLGKTILADAK